MLVDFTVRNYRSIRDEQVFTMVPTKDTSLEGTNVIMTGNKTVPRLLRSAAVFGANASGKSNLIRALSSVSLMVTVSAFEVWDDAGSLFKPFLLDGASPGKPTEFRVTILLDDVPYEYGFSIERNRILSEELLVYKKPKPQKWFKREYNPKTREDEYYFGPYLTGQKRIFQDKTKPTTLFLSVAANLGSDDLKPILEWFKSRLRIFGDEERFLPLDSTIDSIMDSKNKRTIIKLLKAADIHIDEIEVKGEPEDPAVLLYHSVNDTKVPFHIDDESGGTKGLFAMGGLLLEFLEKGTVVVVDELGFNLHPLLLRELVRYFHKPKSNAGNAQLIFTTHDATLLRPLNLFRRDQIWFTHKGWDQCTELKSLSDLKSRKSENWERYYLDGRYDGVPFLDPDVELVD